MKGKLPIVLLVEDNLGHAELIVRSFQRHCIANEIYHVADGRAALDYLFQQGDYAGPAQSPRPNIILLDLRLPKVDGLQVLKNIKTNIDLCRIPVVILTTSEAQRDVARAYKHRANSYLVKPVNFDDFAQQMDDLGLYWLGWNRQPRL